MATITRTEAIEQIQEVLKAYENKIRDIRFDTEKLSPEGKNIVDSYCSNEENEQILVQKAYSQKKFFKKVSEKQLLDFYKVCYELNKNLSLDVKELLLITDIEEDKESFWESFWGALQGEFNEDPSGLSIMLDMGLNIIPFVGQALDARDILACLDKIIRQKRTKEVMIWVTLVLTAIGCVPYAGDVIKAIGKAIVKGADDIIITLLKKLDAEDVYKAFKKFYNKLNESLEEAIKIINQWLLEAEKRYNETDLSELIRNANEYINKAIEFIQTKIDEFAQKMFGNENINKIAKNKTSFANQSQVDAVYSEKSQQSLNSETIISKINNDELIRKYKNRLIDESSNIKKKGGLSDKKVQEILNVPKGSRPNTSEYLSKEYINIHIQKFDNGYSYLLTKNQYKMYVYKKEYLGIPSDGTLFVAPTGFIDELCDLAKNNYAVFESILGFEPGYYSNGNGLIRIDIKADIRFNVRIPTGNEAGVNNYWIPGGFTSGGMPEAITDLIPNTEEFVKISEIKGAK